MGVITIAGLGPAGPELVTQQTRSALEASATTFARTLRHPAAILLGDDVRSFDHLYESATAFGEVYATIADTLCEAAATGDVLYVVPGSPAVAEHTVELLLARRDVTVEVLPALSFADLTWVRLGVDPLAEGVRIVDGRRFAIDAAGERGPLLVAQCDRPHVLSDIKLSVEDDPGVPITVLQGLGTADEQIFTVAWNDLDREVEPDHLTSLYIPRLGDPIGAEFERFAELVRRLRSDCPWDAEQTHESLRRHLLEETYEVLEAIDALATDDDGYVDLEEELGDLLFQVFFHATLATEAGAFTVADVARTVHDKLRDRHPHVFAPGTAEVSLEELTGTWERNKLVEKGRDSLMDGIPAALPGLLFALKTQKRSASAGFSYDEPDDAYADVLAELAEVRAEPSEAEIGDLLFAAVGVARVHGVDPEMAAVRASKVFQERFRLMERFAAEEGLVLAAAGAEAHQRWWAAAKRELAVADDD